MDIITLETINWTAPEYIVKEHSVDFLWGIGLIAILGAGITLWFHSYLFAVFILVSGASLILFSVHRPRDVTFTIKTEGFMIDTVTYEWKNIKGFTIKNDHPYVKLLIMTSRSFLPVFTIPVPQNMMSEVQESLLQVAPVLELQESPSVIFMEKLGF